MTSKRAVAFAGLIFGILQSYPAISGPAVNQFEVKDLESAPGDFEFQSQNAWSTGQPRRKSVQTAPGEFTYDDNSVARQREALEVQLGITDWFRVRLGVEYEQERLDDPQTFGQAESFAPLTFSEVAIEGVIVFVKPKKEGVGLGLLLEYGSPVNEPETPSQFYFGPIIEAHTGPWSLITNTVLVQYIGGKGEPGHDDYVRDNKWDFSYFTQVQYEFSRSWSVAAEAYGTFDRLGTSGTPGAERDHFGDHNQHRAGPVVYYTFFPCPPSLAATGLKGKAVDLSSDDGDGEKEWSVSVGTGVLFGLNENTPDLTYKLSIEVDY
ncbi:MAG: hypothetical protein ABL907_22070 [Hyphomicrobium sp.]